MKKQLIILAASTLLLASCNQINSIKNQYRKKIGTEVEYSEFMSKYTDAVTELNSSEFSALIDAGTPKSSLGKACAATYMDITEKSKAGTAHYLSASSEEQEVKYDEKNDTSYCYKKGTSTSKETFNRKVIHDYSVVEEKETVTSKQYEVDKLDNTYEKGTFIPANGILSMIANFTGSIGFGSDSEYAKWNINGSLFTATLNMPANLMSSDFSENDTIKIVRQINVDANDLFYYTAQDLSGISYTNSRDAKVKFNKYQIAEYISIKSKDVKVKLPDLTKYVNEDYND